MWGGWEGGSSCSCCAAPASPSTGTPGSSSWLWDQQSAGLSRGRWRSHWRRWRACRGARESCPPAPLLVGCYSFLDSEDGSGWTCSALSSRTSSSADCWSSSSVWNCRKYISCLCNCFYDDWVVCEYWGDFITSNMVMLQSSLLANNLPNQLIWKPKSSISWCEKKQRFSPFIS